MDTRKHLDFFNPTVITDEIHVIGCGALGSNIVIQLARLGLTNIHLWDFDTVDEYNITNQIYVFEDIGKTKTEALKNHCLEINPDIIIFTHKKYNDQPIKGYIFSCVDSIETRFRIANQNQYNMFIRLLIDVRMGLEQGQVYPINWRIQNQVENYLKTCDFKDSEVETPVSACGTKLSVSPTVLLITAYSIASFINFNKNLLKHQKIIFDAFNIITKTF